MPVWKQHILKRDFPQSSNNGVCIADNCEKDVSVGDNGKDGGGDHWFEFL